MSLKEYNSKRDFKSTPEPKGNKEKAGKRLRFTIQRHDASSLHYDLRLEMDGVLKSWAVPKGPSLNPKDKRLAIQTEDHPLKYLKFEGTIPKGNYGAGQMWVWDTGTYASVTDQNPEKGLEDGNLKIMLEGEKLKGEFALVHTGGGDKNNQWLLIKKKDRFATDLNYDAENFAPLSASTRLKDDKARVIKLTDMLKPMLATRAEKVPAGSEWLYEIKWDGYRALSNVMKGSVQLYSRNGISYNSKFSEIVEKLKQLENDMVLDGEIVVMDGELPDFQGLQNYKEGSGDLRYYVFDLLYLNGHSLLELPLEDRKSLLPEILEGISKVHYCEHILKGGKSFYEEALNTGLEGIIAKKKDSTYHQGYRSESWLKIKGTESLEALICGYTESDRQSYFGSLILGIKKGDDLHYIGSCGSGFDEDTRHIVYKKMKPLQGKKSPFKNKINLKGREPNWLQPNLVAEVKYSEKTKNGKLRHAVFKGLRIDKQADVIPLNRQVIPTKHTSGKSKDNDILEVGGVKVPISNLDKVFWPDEGFTKYDLMDYYLKVADYILPYLKDRPQNMHRHPNGITKKGFYHKDAGEIMPHWVQTIEIYSESADKDIDYLLCQDEAALLYMVQLGCIEINPWNSTVKHLEKPDYAVIDIDPGDSNSFDEVIEVARASKEILEKSGVESYCKTSGSSGLHVYIPLGAQYEYDDVKDFMQLICKLIQQQLPELTTLERSLKKRNGRIYLDYLQNRRGQTLAAPYCVRPRPGAPVSTPLKWNEVKPGLSPTDFTIQNIPQRLQEGDIFTPVLGRGIDIEKVLDKLS